MKVCGLAITKLATHLVVGTIVRLACQIRRAGHARTWKLRFLNAQGEGVRLSL